MEVDLSKFFGAFFEEAEEHLVSLESLLMGLDLNTPDSEDLNAIFRAAHSIKGGAGTFGFNDLAALTHILENLLDRVRKGSMVITPEMVDIFLRTGDVLAYMIAVHRDGATPDPESIATVQSALEALEHTAGEIPPDTPEAHVYIATRASSPTDWRLNLRLDPTADTATLLASLANLGAITELARQHEGELLLLQLAIQSLDSGEDLRESLAFVLPSDRFELQSHPEPAPPAAGSVASPPSSTASEGTDFGFFDDSPAQAIEAFGFFEPLPAQADAIASTGDTDYGFFEPLPSIAPNAPAGREGVDYGYLDAQAVKQAEAARQAEQAEAQAAAAKAAEASKLAEAAQHNRRAGDKGETATIRVDVTKVDQLLNFVGELVITQSMLAQSASGLDPLLHTRLLAGIDQLQRNTRELQESVMSIRMIPMSTVFSRFPRVVRDLAAKLGKKVELRLVGEQTELDKGFVEKLVDPLTHLVRNSLDHGIESTETRVARGKPETGMLTLAAFQQGGNVVIEVRDDGAGLNRERILAKARENGLPLADGMSDQDVWMLIFEAGFSTAAEVTDVSGRGVGMDVVRKNIQSMGGSVEIESMAGFGSTMRIRLPLTLAILDGMLVGSGGETYILPLNAIRQSLQPVAEQCRTVNGRGRVVQVRNDYLPLIALHEVVGCTPKSSQPTEGIVMLIESGNQQMALWVDELLGQQQVVVKNLEANYRRVQGMSGATILGDGRVALIVDVSALARKA